MTDEQRPPAESGSSSPSREAAVVVPSYNDRDSLESCLEALSRQTLRDRITVIVSLDGGEPLPPELHAMADRVLANAHAGPAAARNSGWRAAATPFILFTDSDCRPEPEWASLMLDALKEGADGVKGAYSEGGRRMIQRLAQVEFEERYSLLGRSGVTDMVDTYSAGFRRSALEKVGGFDESFPCADHEDVDLSYRMLEAGCVFRFEPRARVAHRHRATWGGYFRLKLSRGRWRSVIVRRFPSMLGGGSYTPMGLKLQMLLVLLFPAAVLLGVFLTLHVFILWLMMFLLSCAGLLRTAAPRDPGTLPLVPVFCFIRAAALSLGMLSGIFPGGKGTE